MLEPGKKRLGLMDKHFLASKVEPRRCRNISVLEDY